jgi:hypothetical protein
MKPILDYVRPNLPELRKKRLDQLRFLATALAIVSHVWGILCAIFLSAGFWRAAPLFVPGYIVMVGYFWRAIGDPSRNWARAIWGASLLVQGAWLVWLVVVVVIGKGEWYSLATPMAAWWIASTVLSFIAFHAEPV